MKRARISDATASPIGCRIEVEVEPGEGAELDAERIAAQLRAIVQRERRQPYAVEVCGRTVSIKPRGSRRDVALLLALDAVLLSGLEAIDTTAPPEPAEPLPEPEPVRLEELDLLKSPLVTCEAIEMAMYDRSEPPLLPDAIERATLEAAAAEPERWYPATIRFMRALLRAGGSRLISQRSKFRALARDLHRLGMLELASYAGGVAHYRATKRGRAEFGDSHLVGTDGATIQNGELSSELR